MSLKNVVQVELGRRKHLAGWTLGEQVFEEGLRSAASSLRPQQVLLLSFRDVEFATGSFFKATWLRLREDSENWVPVVVGHLTEEVRHEFEVFLLGLRLPGLEATDWGEAGIEHAKLHGQMESTSQRALMALLNTPGATAPELERLSGESLSPTAWTNRLQELHRNGLAFREKAGRAWRFSPVAKRIEVSHG